MMRHAAVYTNDSDKQKALECGADDFDTKPVDFKRLLEIFRCPKSNSKPTSFGIKFIKSSIISLKYLDCLF